MVDYYKLDKIFVQGTVYQAPADEFLVIKKLGTNADTNAFLKIDGGDTGKVIKDVAPIHKTSSNLLGPLDLKDLHYIVPPNKKFWIEGPAGCKMRCIGQIGKLAPGEAMPSAYAARFAEQTKRYLTYISDDYSLGTNVVWVKEVEYEIYSLTPKTVEKYIFNAYVGASISGNSVAEGDFGIRFYLEGQPLDNLTRDIAKLGIDVLSMPKPPADATEEEVFSLADRPIEVPGDITFTIKASNESGANKAPATGASWTIEVIAIVEYIK